MLAMSILVDYRISENPAAQISSAAHDPRNWHPHNYDNSRPKEFQRLVALRNVRPAQVSGPSDRLLPRPLGLGPRGHRISEGSVELGMAGTHPTLHRDVVLRGGPRVQVHAADGGGGVPGSVRAAWPGAGLVGVLGRCGSAQPAGDGGRGV